MRRRPALDPAELCRVVRDPRFRLAQESRAPDSAWRSRGRCLELDPELFFPAPAEDPTPAVRICHGCSVAGPCLASALDSGELDGVWGATTPQERQVMRQAWRSAPAVRTPTG